MPEFLTTAEFGRWANGHDEKVCRLLDHAESQAKCITTMKVDIGALKATHAADNRHDTGRRTWIGGAIAACAGAIAGALSGRLF